MTPRGCRPSAYDQDMVIKEEATAEFCCRAETKPEIYVVETWLRRKSALQSFGGGLLTFT